MATKTKRTNGVGTPGSQEPVLCVEPLDANTWSDALSEDLLSLASGTRWDQRIRYVLVHPGFPVDARHNAKIRREELARWATPRVPADPRRDV